MKKVILLPLTSIRVSEKQKRKVSEDKVFRHLQSIETGNDTLPIEVHALGDGTYTIAGNGRHRFFAYVFGGYSHIPAIVQNADQTTRTENHVCTSGFSIQLYIK